MEKVTIKEFQNNFDYYIKKVEHGESFLIFDSSGKSAIITPADDNIIKVYTEHNNGF